MTHLNAKRISWKYNSPNLGIVNCHIDVIVSDVDQSIEWIEKCAVKGTIEITSVSEKEYAEVYTIHES